MISKIEFINYVVNKLSYIYNEDKNTLTDSKGNEVDVDKFLDTYKKKTGQSFEYIYNEHVSCFSILRCTECGTYIFEHYDEDYEQNLKCPVCTDYKIGFKYYTVKDIQEDVNKKKEIDIYMDIARMTKEADERYKKRGLYDWERSHKKIIFKSKNRKIEGQILGHDIFDLNFEINIWIKKKDIYTWKRKISIPLSWKSFYMQFIYRHLGKCHKDLRSKFYIGKAKENK